MVLSLSETVLDAEDVVSGLQVFEDNVPEDPELHLSVKDLLALTKRLRSLSFQVERRFDPRLHVDVNLLLSSLQHTLRRVRDMFGETRHVVGGQILYRSAWERLCSEFRAIGMNQGLSARLGIYQLFADDMLDALDGMRLPPGEMIRHRAWIVSLLHNQIPPEERLDSLAVHVSRPRSRRSSRTSNSNTRPLVVAPDGAPYRPPAPEVPEDFDAGSPTPSTATYSSARTFATNSSGTLVAGHWAQVLFNHRPPTTEFVHDLGRTTCHDNSNRDAANRLQQHGFVGVAKFPLQADGMIARFFWRPRDDRARLLISATDDLGTQLRYCITLTELTLFRYGNLLQFRRMTATNKLNPWATLSFPTYEKLVLFHCVYAAMKNQDRRHDSAQALRDFPQNAPSTPLHLDEEQIFAAHIEEGEYVHALRIYFDRDSGASRIEACPHGGGMKCCPIWTAFITEHVHLIGWARKLDERTVRLDFLRPYVFRHGYLPFSGHNGEPLLAFRENSDDADDFMRAVVWLRRQRPPA